MPSRVRLLSFATPFLIFVLFEIIYRRPSWIFTISAIVPFILFGTIYLLMGPHLKTPLARFQFLIAPTLMIWSALAFSLLIERSILRHLLALVVAIFLTLFFESIVTYIWRHEAYEGYSLENLAAYALLLAIFLGSSVLIGMRVLLDINFVIAGIIFLLMSLGINYKFFWISKLPKTPSLLYTIALTITLFELFVALTFLPFHFMVSGALLTVFWYVVTSISRAHLLRILTRRIAYRHIGLGLVLIILLLISARWV